MENKKAHSEGRVEKYSKIATRTLNRKGFLLGQVHGLEHSLLGLEYACIDEGREVLSINGNYTRKELSEKLTRLRIDLIAEENKLEGIRGMLNSHQKILKEIEDKTKDERKL